MNLFIKELKEQKPHQCPICNNKKLLNIGSKDFGISGNDNFENKRMFPDYQKEIQYYECQHCYFVFTNALDEWTYDDFKSYIYNDDYLLSDPPFLEERPTRNAHLIYSLFMREIPDISILDLGGGNGVMQTELTKLGAKIDCFDLFFGENKSQYNKQYDLITSFEVIEHVPAIKQVEWMQQLSKLLKKEKYSRVLLGTELMQTPRNIDWWYICPRNGHISIHSEKSLNLLASNVGLELYSINPSMHLLNP